MHNGCVKATATTKPLGPIRDQRIYNARESFVTMQLRLVTMLSRWVTMFLVWLCQDGFGRRRVQLG